MNKEAIQELARQLGKGVDWVSDSLIPYMYDYVHYKVVVYSIITSVFILLLLFGIIALVTGIKLRLTEKKDEYCYCWSEEATGWCFTAGICISLGLLFSIIALDSLLAWSMAPEVTFIQHMIK